MKKQHETKLEKQQADHVSAERISVPPWNYSELLSCNSPRNGPYCCQSTARADKIPHKMKNVEQFYNTNPKREWDRLSVDPYHSIESEVTKRFIQKYLKPQAGIADIGCGPGHYSIWLMQQGHSVLMADVSSGLLDFAKSEIEKRSFQGKVLGIHHTSATDLGAIKDDSFDLTLLFGPLYHLLDKSDREKALSEAKRITRPGGYIFAAIINRLCPLRDIIFGSTEYWTSEIANDPNPTNQILKSGIYKNESGNPNAFTDAYFAELNEVPDIFRHQKIELIETFSCEGIAAFLDDRAAVIQKNPVAWERFIDLIFSTATNPGILASGEHTVFIGRK